MGKGQVQYTGHSKGTWPYYKGKGKSNGSVHAVTYDDNYYSWGTTGSDI